jgi:hypothetical protein
MNHLTAVNGKSMEYNRFLDSAVDDGTRDLVEIDSRREIYLNKEKAVEQFFVSLYSNFGVIEDELKQRKLQEHIPIILVTDQKGFYLYYLDTYETNEGIIIGGRWSEEYPYTYEDDNYIYNFTLGDTVTAYIKSANAIITGNYKELGTLYTDSVMAKDTFDTIRRLAIIHKLENKMNYYINRYNTIAYQYGITYQFWLPSIDKADWYRTIDDISMFVIFQNYPYYTGSLDTYNRYGFGGARITKSNLYFVKVINGIKYYHKEECAYLDINGLENAYFTKEECALEGAFPCLNCNP